MDAREVIRHFLQGTDLSCDDLITALEWHGNRIVHRDENHGPTLEGFREEIARLLPHYQSQTATDAGRRQILEYMNEWAIRAMEVKP